MKKFISFLILTNSVLISHVYAEGNVEIGGALSTQCSTCHGVGGMSNSEQFPNIAGQKESYLISQLEQYKSGDRVDATMSAIVGPLNTQNIEDLAAYFASNSPVANYSFETETLSLPYVNVGNTIYTIDMVLTSFDDLSFKVKFFKSR